MNNTIASHDISIDYIDMVFQVINSNVSIVSFDEIYDLTTEGFNRTWSNISCKNGIATQDMSQKSCLFVFFVQALLREVFKYLIRWCKYGLCCLISERFSKTIFSQKQN